MATRIRRGRPGGGWRACSMFVFHTRLGGAFRPAMRRRLAAALAVVVGAFVPAAGAQVRSPTPLRLVARTAIGLFSDGERYAVVQRPGRIDSYDTFTGRRRTVTGSGCRVGAVQFFQSNLAAGHAIVT